MLYSFALLASLMSGCGQLEDVKETLEGLTDPLVVEAILIGAVEPESELIDLSETDFADGATIKVFVADATSLDDLESGAMDGVSVDLKSASLGNLPLSAVGGGLYTANGQDGLEYFAGEEYLISVTNGDTQHKVAVAAPHPVDIQLPQQHSVGDNLLIDLTDYEYDTVLVAVLDVQSGELTYSNEPEGIEAMYEATHSGGNVKRHEIPGSAFDVPSVYAVGVAGMRNAVAEDYTEMNTGLSSYLVGQMRFYPVQAM
jgi:hypothetical protein